MFHKFMMLSLCVCLYAEAFAARSVQDLINSGAIQSCFVGTDVLDLSHRGLQSLRGIENVPCIQTITQIFLNHNQLQDLSGLKNIPCAANLRELHVTHNKLRLLDLQQLSVFCMLYVLNVGFNEIQDVVPMQDGTLKKLEVLFLNNNRLHIVHSNSFRAPFLQALYLHNNHINQLQPDCFKGLFNLRLLYLHNNALTHLPSRVFADVHSLHVLYLRNNALQHLDNAWCVGLDELVILDLLYNKLDSVDVKNIKTQDLKSLKYLYL